MKHRSWIALSGVVWFFIGGMLLYKGLHFIAEGTMKKEWLLAAGLLIGFFKGRFVLIKTVRRQVLRIASLPLPIRWSQVYPLAYYFLIAGMMGLGMLMRVIPLSVDFRGVIDVAIGSALIHGALAYFQAAASYTSFDSKRGS